MHAYSLIIAAVLFACSVFCSWSQSRNLTAKFFRSTVLQHIIHVSVNTYHVLLVVVTLSYQIHYTVKNTVV